MTDVPRVVVRRLQNLQQGAEQHLDANLLSAFHEQSLLGWERAQVVEHLSGCAECRELAAIATPELTVEQPLVAAGAGRDRQLWPRLAWNLLAICLIALAAMFVVWHHDQTAQKAAVLNDTSSREEALQQNAAPTAAKVEPQEQTPAIRSRRKQQPNLGAGVEAAPTLMAEAKPESQIVPGRAKDANESGDEIKSGSVPSPTELRLNRPAVPANVAPRWILASDGTLQRSFDSGATWQMVSVSKGTRLQALAANGMNIWVGGAGGVLFHSQDAGEHWDRVQPAAQGHALTADIIEVEFTDPAHGRITTSAQEVWTTADAGQSWKRK